MGVTKYINDIALLIKYLIFKWKRKRATCKCCGFPIDLKKSPIPYHEKCFEDKVKEKEGWYKQGKAYAKYKKIANKREIIIGKDCLFCGESIIGVGRSTPETWLCYNCICLNYF
jgi:hypothetical protein